MRFDEIGLRHLPSILSIRPGAAEIEIEAEYLGFNFNLHLVRSLVAYIHSIQLDPVKRMPLERVGRPDVRPDQ